MAQYLFSAHMSKSAKRQSAHRLGSILRKLVVQGQTRQEIRQDVDAGLMTRFLMTCIFHNIFQGHHAQDTSPLADRLLDSVDALMDGLGGPEWRKG